MGKGLANPLRTFCSTLTTLEHLRESDAPSRLMRTIERVAADGATWTPAPGDKAGITTAAAVICSALEVI